LIHSVSQAVTKAIALSLHDLEKGKEKPTYGQHCQTCGFCGVQPPLLIRKGRRVIPYTIWRNKYRKEGKRGRTARGGAWHCRTRFLHPSISSCESPRDRPWHTYPPIEITRRIVAQLLARVFLMALFCCNFLFFPPAGSIRAPSIVGWMLCLSRSRWRWMGKEQEETGETSNGRLLRAAAA